MMLSILLIALCAALVSAAQGAVCSKAPYKAFLPLSKNNHVQVLCSSRYPLPPVTTTVSTTIRTATVTAFSTTTIITTATPVVLVYNIDNVASTTTVDQASIETENSVLTTTKRAISTVTSTVTTTTITVNANACMKRNAAPTGHTAVKERAAVRTALHGFSKNAKAQKASTACAAFAKSATASQVSTLCSCIGVPQTLSVVATVTVTSTSTSVLSKNSAVTSPTTTTVLRTTTLVTTSTPIPSTTTTLSTLSVTETFLVTATAAVGFNACGQTFGSPLSNTPVVVKCDQKPVLDGKILLRSVSLPSFYDCLVAADADGLATLFTYTICNTVCALYIGSPGNDAASKPNVDFQFGYFYP
nr:hypothetical protein B0A51_06676 [Rachicladosporium sp. CCFEE 5018]